MKGIILAAGKGVRLRSAVVTRMGLVLNYTPFGIRLSPALVSLSVFTIALAVGTCLRRCRVLEESGFEVDFGITFRKFKESLKAADAKLNLDRILSVILVIVIVLAISMVVYVIVTPKQGERFTEFYILGPGGKADDYPTTLHVGEEGEVIIGVVNHEYANVTYQLDIRLEDEVLSEERIELVHNETWECPFTFKASREGEDQKLEFLLFKEGVYETEPYRSLHLWLDVKNESS
ncbi:MAG: DUF1616 domain-containing protein [Methanomicrobia archaeon]|mgnify:CR=1 FL=1|nr:DUF1616 domain-containing protein [Methanomicrobia archaeon]